MNIPGVQVGFQYQGSHLLPKAILGDFGEDTEDILKLSLEYKNPRSMKGHSRDYYLAYDCDEAKRIAFRAMKLQVASLVLVKAHYDLKNLDSDIMMALVREWSQVFGIPLNGLLAFQNVKNKIVNDILKEVDYEVLPYYQMKLFDIQKYDEYSKVNIFDVRSSYRRIA